VDGHREEVENDIIKAATKVFVAKGFKGATMRDIASHANINLAMLNYYFRSKENLFDIIFERAFAQIYGKLFGVLVSDLSIFDKIRCLVGDFIDILLQNPSLPSFIFSEVSLNPTRLTKKLKDNKEFERVFNLIQKQIDDEVKTGILKPTSFLELYMNIDSLCVFPFISKPMFMDIFNHSEKNYSILLEQRKTTIAELLIAGIKA